MGFFTSLFSKALSTELHIGSSNGFHLRPIAKFVSVAKTYPLSIEASFKGKSVDAKAVNALLGLSLEEGDSFTLTCRGKNAREALETLSDIFNSLMQDDKKIDLLKKEPCPYAGERTEGEVIYPGVAMAPVYHYKEKVIRKDSALSFKEALETSFNELDAQFTANKEKSNADIFLAQRELLSSLRQEADSLEALERNIQNASEQLLGTKLEAKISDYQDILHRIKTHLGLKTEILFPDHAFILVADDLLPSQIEKLSESKVQGVILKKTSLNAHTAILLRGEGIISLIADAALEEKQLLILDTRCGAFVPNPSEEDKEKAQQRREKEKTQQKKAMQKRFDAAVTGSGKRIKILANVTDTASAQSAKEEGAEGVGLLRTEFLFTREKPSLEKQTESYKKIFDLFDEITIRTLDVGGDKALPYIDLIQEENPFLGIRGVRLFQTHPQIMAEQLHAIFQAAQNRAVKVMFPMVSSVEEFTHAKSFAKKIAEENRIDISNIRFGIMVEVPSVLFLLKEFNAVVDFYSIGTNDLTQYLFAIERTHTTLKANDLSPAVFDAIKHCVDTVDKPLSICGELAGNPNAIPKLIEIGINTLSVSVKNIATCKETIRNV